MDWTPPFIWLLCVSVCECWRLARSLPALHGVVQSPQFPQPYPAALSQQWDLSVPEGYQLQLSFTHLDIEPSADCYYDSLTVLYDKKVLAKFCGQENSADGHHPGNQPLLSPGNRLTLVLQTNDTNPEPHKHFGFSAHYQAKDIDECSAPDPEDGSGPLCSQLCHNTLGSYMCSCRHGYELRPDQHTCVLSCGRGIFDEPGGTLSSPGYPDPSPHGLACQYVISVEPGFIVNLNFTDSFHIEHIGTQNGPSCLYHWLQVSIPDKEPQKLCGVKSPGLMATNSYTVQLDYHTDWAGLSQGWSLHYTTQRVQCASPSSITNGRVTPNFPQYYYRDYIQVSCDPGYKLMMDGREIKSYASMCQKNGQWHLSLPECHIIDCGEPEALLNGGVRFISGSQNQHLSVIQYHCNEPFYSLLGGATVSYTCAADRTWRDNLDTPVIPSCIPVCGQPTVSFSGFQRIMGGDKAPDKTIPWQVMLSVDGGRAGAMVIGDRWIMTTAHNLVHQGKLVLKEKLLVFVGDNDAEKLAKLTPLGVASLHPHPEYKNPDKASYNHDIALIKLQQPLTFHAAIMPLCLPPENAAYKSGQIGMVSGFGIKEDDIIANDLRYILLPVVDGDACQDSVNKAKAAMPTETIPVLTDNMFCAGVPEGGKDSCMGDAGGAYVLRDGSTKRFWAAGIVSWGVGCGQTGRYGVYTRVAKYISWINKTMEDNK
ncbi:complement C1r-A subcomponent-like isoform X2 [Salvelinus fontinalis]|uniref:complement C1r-A subcomponent-like isoform X2 n=1 Tax=Salvelinus fontinalis TaxID=8038 RepID=UPI002486336D|nr:complement C1r-A subcomponent-like isoform X2 [Salvelinus fontinalis]